MKKYNRWKIAFWIQFMLLVPMLVFMMYGIIDQGYALTYGRVGYEDIEHDLRALIGVAQDKLTKADFAEFIGKEPEALEGNVLQWHRVTIYFNDENNIDSIQLK